jgi:hypothetical protein
LAPEEPVIEPSVFAFFYIKIIGVSLINRYSFFTPFKEGCYTEGAKSKTYSVSIKSNEHTEQAKFQVSEDFKEKSKELYKIEAKNSELKHRHGYNVAKSSGLIGMELQSAMAILKNIETNELK